MLMNRAQAVVRLSGNSNVFATSKYRLQNTGCRRHFSKIGFIGLGNMGNPMVRNLLKKGHKVSVFDISQNNVAALVKEGATGCENVTAVAAGADAVFTMLPKGPDVLDVYTRKGGVLESVQKGALLVDSSTVDPGVSQTLASLAKEKGASYLDAPVSGGTIGAEAGTLAFMVGGEAGDVKRVEPILQCMGARVFHCGKHGMGLVAKLANNMLLGISMGGVAEAMNLGIRLGMDAKTLMDVFNSSTGRCWSSELYNPVPGLIPNTPSSNGFKGGFSVSLITKDLGLAQDVATKSNIPIPFGSQAHQVYRHMSVKKLGDKDFTVYYKFLQEESV